MTPREHIEPDEVSAKLTETFMELLLRTIQELAQTRETFALIRVNLESKIADAFGRINGLEGQIVALRAQVIELSSRRAEKAAALDRRTMIIVALIGFAGVLAGSVLVPTIQMFRALWLSL